MQKEEYILRRKERKCRATPLLSSLQSSIPNPRKSTSGEGGEREIHFSLRCYQNILALILARNTHTALHPALFSKGTAEICISSLEKHSIKLTIQSFLLKILVTTNNFHATFVTLILNLFLSFLGRKLFIFVICNQKGEEKFKF